MNSGSLHTRNLRRIHFSVLDTENLKLDLRARKVSGAFEKWTPGACFSKLPVITRPVKLFLFSIIPDGSFNSFENYTVSLSAKETKWTSSEVKTHPIFLETLI